MQDRTSLLNACLEQPADDLVRGVYADHLRESDDPHDVQLGRFIWAGLEIARLKNQPDPLAEPGWRAAACELDDTTSRVVEGHLKTLFPGNKPKWSWGSKWDEVEVAATVSGVNLRLTYRRGMVAAVQCPITVFEDVAAAVLPVCPVERFTFAGAKYAELRVERGTGPTPWSAVLEYDRPQRREQVAAETGLFDFGIRATVTATRLHAKAEVGNHAYRGALVDSLLAGFGAMVSDVAQVVSLRLLGLPEEGV